jgi:uncharacterized repeat protein (TIGR01451 family)
MGARVRTPVLVILTSAALAAGTLAGQAGPAFASQDGVRSSAAAQASGAAEPIPAARATSGARAVMGPKRAAATAATAAQAAEATARRTGRPVVVPSSTTATTTVTAQPRGGLRLDESLQPVRVRRGAGWVPVSTRLRREGDGRWAAAAVPADTVTFSGGGSGPVAAISAGGTSLGLSLGKSLPAPVISGATATYQDVLPGIDLTLRATSADAGGFAAVLTVSDRAAASDPGLSRLAFGVRGHGARLTAGPGGSLVAQAASGAGEYSAAAPVMWDSSAAPVSLGGTAQAGQAAQAALAARQVGASLVVPGAAGPSSAAGPAAGARIAPVRDAVERRGTVLALTPDAALLASRSTRFPVFITPSLFEWDTITGDEQHRDEVQSACPGAPHYDQPATYPDTYWSLGVGYDDWPNGDCTPPGGTQPVPGHAMSYYQVGVPSAIWGAHLDTATIDAQEAWAASCTVKANVTLSHTGTINSNTAWDNAPGPMASLSPQSITPDQKVKSCDTQIQTNPSSWEGVGFNVLSYLTAEAADHASDFTYRLWEQNSPPDTEWVRFGPSPTLQVTYSDTPNVPDNEKATANSAGSGSVGCDTSTASPPALGKTASVHGPYLWAELSTNDGDDLQGTFQYWDQSTSGAKATVAAQAIVSSGGTALGEIPSSFFTPLKNGTVVGWQVNASNGMFTSAWSAPCYFTVDPNAPDPPVIADNLAGANATMGQTVTFTITSSNPSGDAATGFVWGLDVPPPVVGAPADQQITLNGKTSATLKVTVPSPGPHSMWAYAVDSAGNESGISSDPFSADGDPEVPYSSFAAALAGGESFDNTMIAPGSGQVNGDGAGHSFAASDLENAGWQPGGTVTVDGATFTLPDFGTGKPDNLLAANQEIGMGGAQGSALVFLATSTDATTSIPGTSTGAPDGLLTGDEDAPIVAGGVPVTGTGCTAATTFDANQSGCVPATGTINFTDGGSEPYDLAVPDWSAGPTDIAAGSFTHEVCNPACTYQQGRLYAFAVPIVQGQAIQSVTLPDVGDTVSATVSGTGVSYQQPALHIVGMAIRNTTTSTPGASPAANQATAGQAWTAAFASPVEDGYAPASGSWGNQTIRMAVSPSVTAAKGSSYVRIRLSDPAFQAGQGGQPLEIGAATIAPQSAAGSPVPASAPKPLSFDGAASVTIPAGGDAYSDPLQLPFGVTAGKGLLVSLYLENGASLAGQPAAPPAVPYLPGHSWASGAAQWVSPAPAHASTSGNQTSDTTGTPFTGTGSAHSVATSLLASVDATASTTTNPAGMPSVVVAGNNLTDPNSPGTYAVTDPIAPSIRVAGQLAGLAGADGYAVTDAGIESNQVLADGTSSGGPSLLARLDSDILAEPDVGTVIVNEGLEDLLKAGASDTITGQLNDAYGALISVLDAFGVNVTIGTVTPCSPYTNGAGDTCTSNSADPPDTCQGNVSSTLPESVDLNRDLVNNDICQGGEVLPLPCIADVDAAVSNLSSPEQLASGDTHDYVNLNSAGYAAVAGAVIAAGCQPAANSYPLPPAPS